MKHFNNNLKKFWENPVLWEQYNIKGKDYQDRLLAIKAMIQMMPCSINTVVDVGCGKGDVLTAIEADTKIALDISETALMHIQNKNIIKVKGSVTELDKLLPNNVNQVDLLICLEVLEHLLDDELKKAVENIKKLEPKFLLIGVPFKEPLARRSFYCNNCGKLFNADTHFRAFNKKDCCDLFGEKYSLVKEAYVGHSYPRLHSYFYILKNRYIKPDEFAVCYHCGNSNFSMDNSLKKRIVRYLISKLERIFYYLLFWKRYPYWILLLFEHKER